MSIFDFSKIISTSSSVFKYISKAIPIYKQAVPTIKDIKKTYDSYKSIKDAAKDATFSEIKSFERPKRSIIKKDNINNRGNLIDSLTLFSQKKN